MKKPVIVCLIIAGCLILAGAALFTGALASAGWDLSKLSNAKYESSSADVSEKFDSIQIDTDTTDIILAPSQDKKCKVEYYDSDKIEYTASVKDKTLCITKTDNRKWYEKFTFFIFDSPRMTVYLPEKDYDSLLIETHTGDVDVPADFSFKNIGITGDTSDIGCSASAEDGVKIETSTGDITFSSRAAGKVDLSATTGEIKLNGVKAKGDINIGTSTGDITLTGTVTEKSLISESTTGDVQFEKSDAQSIAVKTTTGDVTGTLLTDKVFVTNTSTGSVSVPPSSSGGTCEIVTSTGDINISIAK